MNAYLCGINLKLYQNEKDYTYHIRRIGLHRNRLCPAFSAKERTLRIGNSVTSSKPTGDVVFEDGRILVVANEVNVQPGTEVELGTEVEFKQK